MPEIILPVHLQDLLGQAERMSHLLTRLDGSEKDKARVQKAQQIAQSFLEDYKNYLCPGRIHA